MKKNLRLLNLSFSFLIFHSTQGQPNIEWQKSFGGTGTDAAESIQQTSAGGFIVAGHSDSNNGDITGNHSGR
jgi:hypothetical protein